MGLPVRIIHYLDDFLLVLPPGSELQRYSDVFSELSARVGFSIKVIKNEEGSIARFAGIKIDTETMVIRLPTKKLQKAQDLVQNALPRRSAMLLELQKITGYLNFVSTVVPLGCTFLRRHYNMELYCAAGGRYYRRCLSTEARQDLIWWQDVLRGEPRRSIPTREQETISTWADGSCTKGIGAFYKCATQPLPQVDSAFAIELPSNLSRRREHINTQEMRAVEQGLLHWVERWRGHSVIVHMDNQTEAYGIANGTTRGKSMAVLRTCMLPATRYYLELEARWISTKENALADALSRFDYQRITDLAQQLTQPEAYPQMLGLQTFTKPDCQLSLPTISGGVSHLLRDGTMTPQGHGLLFSAPYQTFTTQRESASLPE